MIDIHCHILPGFDDGASSLEESLTMACMASSCGVTGIVATPHFPGKSDSLRRMGELLEKYQLLREAIAGEGIPLTLIPGAEVLCLPETTQLAKQQALPTIGDTSYLLAEFFFNESSSYMSQTLHALADAGYKPVVAHPERYKAVQKNIRLLQFWFDSGYVIQVNKDSLLGAFGPQVQECANNIIQAGMAHVIASDAHSSYRRTTHMGGLQRWANDYCNPDYFRILTQRNPARLVEDRSMVPIV
jgi:protein-tyrosine phosphatase